MRSWENPRDPDRMGPRQHDVRCCPEAASAGVSQRGSAHHDSYEAFKEYRLALMPYLIQDEKERSLNVQRALAEEFDRGPMKVQALDAEQPGVKSRLKKVAAAARSAEPAVDWTRRNRGAVSPVRMAP